jgi:hypothetical protein
VFGALAQRQFEPSGDMPQEGTDSLSFVPEPSGKEVQGVR